MGASRNLQTVRSLGTGLADREEVAALFPGAGVDRDAALIGKLSETVGYASFTDGGGAAGTYQMQGSIPAGAVLLGSKILVPEGFAGDTSAVVTVGDGTDVDRYMTGTPDVFTTAASGVESGVPSGSKLLTALNRPTITITTNADWGSVTAGEITVEIYYIDA